MKIKTEHLEQYLKLRDDIDAQTTKLENEHKKHMKCKSGCDLCCMDYSIFPVEYYSILENLQKNTPVQNPENTICKEGCVFLKENKCTIYESRPIICRTHGLPLLFTGEEGEWELSACELNFTEFDFEKFSMENTFPQDTFNSKLFLLNKKFITENAELKFSEFDLIPLKQIISENKNDKLF